MIYLSVALAEDTLLFLMSGSRPICGSASFMRQRPPASTLHGCGVPEANGPHLPWFRPSTLWRWRKELVWLAVTAGARFSDLFTDVSYILTVPSLTTLGWILLLPPPVLNLVGVVILLRGYYQARKPAAK